MFNISCPVCGKDAVLDTENGSLICKCGKAVNITELNLPEYGPYKRSTYINELAEKNSFPDTDCTRSEGITYNFPEIMNSSFSISDAAHIIKQWSGNSIFNNRSFNKALKNMDLSLSYVPLFVYDINSSAKLNAVAAVNDDSDFSGEKIMRTHYYNIEHLDDYSDIHVRSASSAISDEILPDILPYDFSDTSSYEKTADTKTYPIITADKDVLYKKIVTDISEHMKKKLLSSADEYSSIYNYEAEVLPFTANVRTVYVPLWKMNYRHKRNTRTILINGQSGKIYGSTPLSFIKTAALTALSGLFIFIIFAAVILSIM